MARTFEVFQNTLEVDSTTADVVVENDGTGDFLVRRITIHNHTGTARNLKLWRVPGVGGNPGSESDANRFFNETILAGESRSIDIRMMILPTDGDSIKALAAVSSAITISVDGGIDTDADAFTRLSDSIEVPNSATAVVTNAATGKKVVKFIHVHNQTGASVNLKLFRVPNNAGSVGTAANANEFFDEGIDANDYRVLDVDPMVLDAENDTIQAQAGSANDLTMSIDGLVV